jgi:hypothetical protein
VDNPHVAADTTKVKKGKALSPVLLIRGNFVRGVPAQIADGYHRVCASYHIDENTDIPCHIVDTADTTATSDSTAITPTSGQPVENTPR